MKKLQPPSIQRHKGSKVLYEGFYMLFLAQKGRRNYILPEISRLKVIIYNPSIHYPMRGFFNEQ